MRVFECAGKTYRMTRQRQAVLDVLRTGTAHEDALRVYEEVRQVMPGISLGTVLRTLSLLREAGFIAQQRPGANASQDVGYDMRCQALCLRCGRTTTATLNAPVDLKEQAQAVTGFAITDHHLELRGLCPDCA